MGKKKDAAPAGTHDDKADHTGRRAGRFIIMTLIVLALVIGAAYVIKTSASERDHDKQDSSTVSSIEQDKTDSGSEDAGDTGDSSVKEDGKYTKAEDVARYIHIYHKLPSNYVSLKEAKKKGWKRHECPADYGIMIGGRKFGNREKKLPKGEYYECDVDYDGKARGINRLVYTEDGIVYHSKDHYISFTRLY